MDVRGPGPCRTPRSSLGPLTAGIAPVRGRAGGDLGAQVRTSCCPGPAAAGTVIPARPVGAPAPPVGGFIREATSRRRRVGSGRQRDSPDMAFRHRRAQGAPGALSASGACPGGSGPRASPVIGVGGVARWRPPSGRSLNHRRGPEGPGWSPGGEPPRPSRGRDGGGGLRGVEPPR